MKQKERKNGRLFKKLHRWPGLIISFILCYYAVSGILMNHRDWLSGFDVGRSWLPDDYHYHNWNSSAIKGNLMINNDSILVFGNIGIWVTDSSFSSYRSMNQGFPGGTDNRKIGDVFRSPKGDLYAATLFGLYGFDTTSLSWTKFNIEVDIKRFVAIENVGDTIYAMNRSYVFRGLSEGVNTQFQRIPVEAPAGYNPRVSLFKTIWQIHSGEILGLPGKIFVDFLGLLTFFLSVTGIIYFWGPGLIRKRKARNISVVNLVKINAWSLRWHNSFGAWTWILLIILFFSGMFLRPPLLITIANAEISPIKFTHLDQPNPWYDELRDLRYNSETKTFLLATGKGMYLWKGPGAIPEPAYIQPPVSVMGINAFLPAGENYYLVGSFSGLFLWNPEKPVIYNVIRRIPWEPVESGRPISENPIAGVLMLPGNRLTYVDYNTGVTPVDGFENFPEMPQNVRQESGMSLWNLMLEIHTGRIFRFMLSDFYILIVPLTGLLSIMVVISGYLVWRRRYKKSNHI